MFSDAEVKDGGCGPIETGDFQGWKTLFIYVFILLEGQGEIELLESKLRGRHHLMCFRLVRHKRNSELSEDTLLSIFS